MDKLKCSFCEREATYSMGIVTDTGYLENNACEEHRYQGVAQQNFLVQQQEFMERVKIGIDIFPQSFIK